MDLEQRISAFFQLGKILSNFKKNEEWRGFESGLSEGEFQRFNKIISHLYVFNGWFTEENVRFSLGSIAAMLTEENLRKWTLNYEVNSSKQKKVAIVMAGNIPLVGFHDFLCVLMTGNIALLKMSSEDDQLIPVICEILYTINPAFETQVEYVKGKLERFNAVIATGSNNSARYFDYYFGKFPNIIRKGRTSVAVLTGEETEEEMKLLGKDVFQYFGMGCRNVTKLFIPKGYDLDLFFGGVYDYKDILNHNKYANNYHYHKAIWLMNGDDLLENGFLLVKEDKSLFSPVGSVFYEYYDSEKDLENRLKEEEEQIQCIVSKKHIPFGKAQSPALWDYADGVDTMKFLLNI